MSPSPKTASLFQNRELLKAAARGALSKLRPTDQLRNPVMLVVYACAFVSSGTTIIDVATAESSAFSFQISLWLWFTVLFANFAEALAEGRGKAQAESLRRTRKDTPARRLTPSGMEEKIFAAALRAGDTVICEAGEVIPGDGEIIEGIASIDESAITGESAPVIRESGGDRSAVTGGTRVLSDRIVIRITADAGHSFLDRMIAMVEGARRQRTPNEIALSILLLSLTVIFFLAVISLKAFVVYSEAGAGGDAQAAGVTELIALLVCLIPTTIGGLLSAIGISGMDRLLRKNVVTLSGKAVEAAGDIDVLLLDKTGTVTLGNRMASEFQPLPGVTQFRLAEAAQLASLADSTPEGRSIVVLAKNMHGLRARDLTAAGARFIEFTAQTRMSGVDLSIGGHPEPRQIRKGAVDAIRKFLQSKNHSWPDALQTMADEAARLGATPLAICDGGEALGIVVLKDVVKGGIRERFHRLRRMGIRTVMITGDNSLTAAAIAAEAGVDDFVAEATPEKKLGRIREEQSRGLLVGMIGDGTNDAPALAQADIGVAMNTGTQAARDAGNMIDLDSNPTKLIEIVETGKQLLMTRGSLTTFSIANDIAKYFAILPAMLASLYATAGTAGPLAVLNVMRLSSPESAILSAVIFNALIIPALIPLALKGVAYRPLGAPALLRRNMWIYGLGGVLAPFAGIKAIDLLITVLQRV